MHVLNQVHRPLGKVPWPSRLPAGLGGLQSPAHSLGSKDWRKELISLFLLDVPSSPDHPRSPPMGRSGLRQQRSQHSLCHCHL